MKIFEKHKKYKKYTLFNPSNYSSSEFYDMSTSNSKRFSFISDFQDEDSFYRPFLKKVRKIHIHNVRIISRIASDR